MTDPRDETIALLRRLAVACDACSVAREIPAGAVASATDAEMLADQRDILAGALPGVTWPAARDRLHALADALEVPDDR